MKRSNSFDFIRLIAALMVVFSHSFALTGHPEPTIGSVSVGAVGVWIFFILSGYLIAASWDQYPRFNVFFAKRALRIFPGLFVAILLTIVVCGLFYSSLPANVFFWEPGTISYLNNILLLNPGFFLPGVFTENPFAGGVNGSVWTLAYEFLMYIAVALIGVFHVYKKFSIFRIWIFLFVLELIICLIGVSHFQFSIFYLNLDRVVLLGLLFFTGIIAHKETARIKLDSRIGLLSLVVFILLMIFIPQFSSLYAALFLSYAIFALGKSDLMSWVGKYGDFSYGIYIYSFPIQQMIVASTQTRNAIKLFGVSSIVTAVIAALSWYLVESRALRLKKKINTKRYPLLQADEAW